MIPLRSDEGSWWQKGNNEAEGLFSVILTESRIEMWEVVTTANSNPEDRRPVSEYSVIPDESKFVIIGLQVLANEKTAQRSLFLSFEINNWYPVTV